MGRRSLLLAVVVIGGVALWWMALGQRPDSDAELPGEPSALPTPDTQREAQPEVARATEIEPGEAEPDNQPVNEAAPASPPQPSAAPQPSEAPQALPAPERSGPVAELKQAFEEEPRDSAAHDPESRIESEFRRSDIAPGTLKSVLCRASVCKAEVLWTPERAFSFMAAFTRLSADFDPGIAIDPQGNAGSSQPLQVDVYLPRRGARP